ncbi:HNH endonuclease [Lactococcus lactis]|uniref:HNH endonuclease n=1 Tax=Lactococcus lactis TaxID=1358 RepID=UPI0032E39200
MEMKQIPDYPNYAVTRDGRVWSYNTNKFLVPYLTKKNIVVINLSVEGMCFKRSLSRLVFITFNAYEPEIVRHKDNNPTNNCLKNLEGISKEEHLKRLGNASNFKNQKRRKMIKLNPETGGKEVVVYPYKSTEYDCALKCCNFKRLTFRGNLYFYPERKDQLMDEIIKRIRLNELYISSHPEDIQGKYACKRRITENKKYLEILEKI